MVKTLDEFFPSAISKLMRETRVELIYISTSWWIQPRNLDELKSWDHFNTFNTEGNFLIPGNN